MIKNNPSIKTDSPSKGTDCVPKGYKIASVPYQRDKEYTIRTGGGGWYFVGWSVVPTARTSLFQSKQGTCYWEAPENVFEKIEMNTLWLNIYLDRSEGFYYSGVDCFSTESAAEDDGQGHVEYVKTVKVEFYDAP